MAAKYARAEANCKKIARIRAGNRRYRAREALDAWTFVNRLEDAMSRAVPLARDPEHRSSPAETAAYALVAALGALLAAAPVPGASPGPAHPRPLPRAGGSGPLARALVAHDRRVARRLGGLGRRQRHRPAHPVARFDAVRDLVARQRDAITSAVLAHPPGTTVCLPNEPVPVSVGFPGTVGIFMRSTTRTRSTAGGSTSCPRTPPSSPCASRAAGSARSSCRPATARRAPDDRFTLHADERG